MSSAKIQWIADLEDLNQDFLLENKSAFKSCRKGEVYLPSVENVIRLQGKAFLQKKVNNAEGNPVSIFDHEEVREYVGANYNSNNFSLGCKVIWKEEEQNINAFVNTSLYLKSEIENQTEENSLKTMDLFFDRDAGDHVRSMTLDEKKAYFKGEIETFVKAHEEFWGVKPNYITMVSGGYHSHTICDRFTGISDRLINLLYEFSQDKEKMAKYNDENDKKFINKIINLKNEKLSNVSGLPLTQSTLHHYLYEAFLLYVDNKMGQDKYLDEKCGSIGRLTRDIGFYHTKDYSNPTLIVPVFQDLCDVKSAISFDKVNLSLIDSDIQKKVLERQTKKVLSSQNNKADANNFDSVFSDSKTEDEKRWIKTRALALLREDALIKSLMDNKIEVGHFSWDGLALNIAYFSYIDEKGNNPAFELFLDLTSKCRSPKHISEATVVFNNALKRVSKNHLAVTYETIMDRTIGHHKYTSSSKFLSSFDKSKFIKKSPYHSVLNQLKEEFKNQFQKPLYDNAKLLSYKDMGLSLDKNGNVLNLHTNLRIILQKDDLLQKMFKFDMLSGCIKAHQNLRSLIIDYSTDIETQILEQLNGDDFLPLYCCSINDDLAKVVQSYLQNQYNVVFEEKSIMTQINNAFKTHPNHDLKFHLIHDMLKARKEDWIKAGKPNVIDTWLPESHHINAKTSPNYYKYLSIKSRKLLLGHIERAYSQNSSASKVEYFFGSVGSGEGTGKSSQSDTILLSLFGIDPKDETSKQVLTRLKTDEDVLNKSDKDLLMLVEGKFISIIEELSQDIISKKGSDHLKMMITKAKVEGRRPWAMSNEILAFTHLHYFTSNNPNILYEQDTDHRRYLIDSLDYLDETNPIYYATQLVDKKTKQVSQVQVNNKGNKGFIDRDKQWEMLQLAWGQAFAYYNGEMPEDELNKLKLEGRLFNADGIDMQKAIKSPSIKVKREDLMLSPDEQEIVGFVNRKFQNQNDCLQSILMGFLTSHKENFLEANHFKANDTYKEYADNSKWKQIVKVFSSLEHPLVKKRIGSREVYRFIDKDTGKVLDSNPYLNESSLSVSSFNDPLSDVMDAPAKDDKQAQIEALQAQIEALQKQLASANQVQPKVEAPKPEVQKEDIAKQVENVVQVTTNNFSKLTDNEWNEIMVNKIPIARKSLTTNNFVEARKYITSAVNILEKKGIRCEETILKV